MPGSPRKLYYKIGEVCDICSIQPHVLRYWETEFEVLAPHKNRSGQRIYRRKDLELIETIKYLLYEEGYTIAGANKRLLESARDELPLFQKSMKPAERVTLGEVRQRLQQILEILDRGDARR